MKLTTRIKIQKIRIIADYRKKENNPMFAAILKAAYENGNTLSVENARNWLTGEELNNRMWTNILDRLTAQDYFEKWNDVYELTEFGIETAQKNTFFKPMRGELEIWLVKNRIDWFPFQIVKIVEKDNQKYKPDQYEKGKKNPRIQGLFSNINFDLNGTIFRLDKWEPNWQFVRVDDLKLSVEINETNAIAKIEDLEFVLPEKYNKAYLQGLFLDQKYDDDYDISQNVVKINFDGNTQFERKVEIQKPQIETVDFDKISLLNIDFTAKTSVEAQKWRLAWLKSNLNNYIFENADLEKLDYKIWKQFEPYYKLPILSLGEFEDYLSKDPENNFYELMKLQAPQILSY